MSISSVIHVLANFGSGELKISGSKKCDCTVSPVSDEELHEGGNSTHLLLSFSVRLPYSLQISINQLSQLQACWDGHFTNIKQEILKSSG